MGDPDVFDPLPLAGVRVFEVATFVFAPVAGAILAEWGAEVVKVEDPVTGDPYRSLVTSGLHKLHGGVDPYFQSANRGKKSVGVDLKHPGGRALLARLLGTADVFMTNLRADARRRLHLDVADIRADNPAAIYVRGTAFGPRGPDAERGGYDVGAYWARSGIQHALTPPDAAWPTPAPPAVGDVVAALAIVGGVGAALHRRSTTGEPSVVDASLLAAGMWQLQPTIVNAGLDAGDPAQPVGGASGEARPERSSGGAAVPDRSSVANPLMLPYRTADGRFIAVTLLASERHWSDFCRAIGHPGLATDPRFVDHDARQRNASACVELLNAIFAGRDLAAWRQALAGFAGEWGVVQTPAELHEDPQVRINGYIAEVDVSGVAIPLVTAPAQFDERPNRPTRAPEHGEHTEAVLLESGLSWDEIGDLKEAGVIL